MHRSPCTSSSLDPSPVSPPHVDVQELRRDVRKREESMGITKTLFQLVVGGKKNGKEIEDEETRMVCSLKTLYSDFVVREQSPLYQSGVPLVLELPESLSTGKKRARMEEPGNVSSSPSVTPGAREILEALKEVLNSDDWNVLKNGVNNKQEKIILEHVSKKEDRTKVHQCVRQFLSASYLSSTENQKLVIEKTTAAGRRMQRQRSTPLRQRTFLHFTLYKENMDSAHAIRCIAKQLHLSTRQIQFCGTKDKRAVTLQRMAIRDMEPFRLASVNRCSFGPMQRIKVGGFQELPDGLRLGDSNGNHFTVVLRIFPQDSSSFSSMSLEKVVQTLQTDGVINYFGPQRFGTTEILTSDIGLAILQHRVKDAVRLMFTSKCIFVPAMRPALAYLEKEDFEAALQCTPHFCLQEKDMLRHLVHHPRDYHGALLSIPRTVAMLYCHAVQSLIWNQLASRRLSDSTRVKVEVGDLVFERVFQRRCHELGNTSTVQEEAACTEAPFLSDMPAAPLLTEEEAGVGEHRGADDDDVDDNDDDPSGEGNRKAEGGPFPAIHRLTKDDPLDAFSLLDVLLPVPGPDPALLFPHCSGCEKNDIRQMLEALHVSDILLAPDEPEKSAELPPPETPHAEKVTDTTKDEEEKKHHHSRQKALLQFFHFHGTYRPLLVRPQRVGLRRQEVSSWTTPVLLTDWETQSSSSSSSSVMAPSASTSEGTTEVSALGSLPSSSSSSVMPEIHDVPHMAFVDTTAAAADQHPLSTSPPPTTTVIVADFSLPSGSYATSVLREFTMFSLNTHSGKGELE